MNRPAPRLLNKTQAAAYCGLSIARFDAVCPVAPCVLGVGDRMKRWDIHRLDTWLDNLSREAAPSPLDRLAEVGVKDGGRARARAQ